MVKPEPDLSANMENDELVIPLGNGGAILSGWIDTDDPDAKPFGDYLSVVNAEGRQVYYIETSELCDLGLLRGRDELIRFFKACLGHDQIRDLQA